MNDDPIKQWIVVRADLGMSRGKMAAQVAHAAMIWIVRHLGVALATHEGVGYTLHGVPISDDQSEWITKAFTKIVLRVESEEELREILRQGNEAGLESYMVTDKGLTEFDGVPTPTCVAIGPTRASKATPIIGHLKTFR
jgi:PTH2 family peptidyl-tRNA hydrolase